MQNFISLPSSPKRVAWDIVGAVLILYDLFAIPMKVFEPPDNLFTEIMDWFALIFWTINMFASITVAYVKDGKYEMEFRYIVRNYMKFWFWIDIAVVAPDWTFTLAQLFMGSENNAGSSVKLLRILRLVRCMRLLRLAKLKWIIASIKDLIDSESIDILFNIIKMLATLIAVNHFIACFWFATTLIDTGPSWVQIHHFDKDDVSWGYQYVTSFHWAITQFTPSSMHVQPQNILERTFAITVVILGLVGFSYLVGSITGSLTELRRMNEEATKQFWNLRRFLKKSGVNIQLRVKIEKYVEHAWHAQKASITNTNLPILRLLTEQLKNELNWAMSKPHLEVHPLFKYMSEHCALAMQRVATKALTRKLLARHEPFFHAGEIAQHMSFLTRGRLKYIKEGQFSDIEWVDADEDWITEPALWTPQWVTLGELLAERVSEVIEVSSTDFADAIKRTPQVFDRVSTYATNYMCWLNKHRATMSDITQGDEVSEEIEAMLWEQLDEDQPQVMRQENR